MVSDLSMRERAGETAAGLLDEDPRVAVVLAEISTGQFGRALRAHPDRAVNVGIMEQTMVGVAAGFAMEGFLPIVHTITPFLVERPLEQIKLDFGYQGLEGTFVSVGGSYDYTSEGFTHHSPGDVQVMLTVPGMQVMVPGTPDELERLFRATYANGHITYLRPSTATNAESREVDIGRLDVVRRGGRATIVAVGPMLDRTLAAVEGMDVTVLYVTSVAPFDADGLAREAADALEVISVTPFLEGTLTPTLTYALAVPAVALHVDRRRRRRAARVRDGRRSRPGARPGRATASASGSRASSSGSSSAYPVPMTELPSDVLMRLGPSPQDLTRLGSSRVLRGNGLVAKTGLARGDRARGVPVRRGGGVAAGRRYPRSSRPVRAGS